ncbi:ABC transporter permease [Rhodococcoides fascians]|uniref:ABC transporter permease n=1 Tax=Rhodococcoides fascians TaxID=1828 RepID=UPI00068B8FB0|nr:ABC transporter permease [Rhodococcus fascians]
MNHPPTAPDAPRTATVVAPTSTASVAPVAHPAPCFLQRVLASRVNVACLLFLGILAVVALFAPLLAPYPQSMQNLTNSFATPLSDGHLLGTDHLGRDVLSRLIYSTRVSLLAPLLAVAVASVIGVPLGLIAGFVGGKLDWVLSRLADALIALPALVVALALIGALGPSLTNAMIAVGIAYAPVVLRIVRGQALAVRSETYIEAATVVGCSTFRTLRVHVLPNVRSPLLVTISLLMGHALLTEAALSFLGMGVQPPGASWGSMLRTASENTFSGPWLPWFPGIAIVLTVLALNLLGDGVRDAIGRERSTR